MKAEFYNDNTADQSWSCMTIKNGGNDIDNMLHLALMMIATIIMIMVMKMIIAMVNDR